MSKLETENENLTDIIRLEDYVVGTVSELICVNCGAKMGVEHE